MNIKDKHNIEKPVSTFSLFKGGDGTATAMQILNGQQLKEHITKVPALLLCITGSVIFENEKGANVPLLPGDYLTIEPMVKHWVNANDDSQLLLLK